MQTISSLNLQKAKPSDRPHLLLWDTPNDLELNHLAFQEKAQSISYRNNLLNRIDLKSRFLVLHERLDLELAAIKQLCASSNKPVVLLKDVDCLIAYLNTQPEAPITLFWKKLMDMRHLENILWLVLPSKLAPESWPETRLLRVTTNLF